MIKDYFANYFLQHSDVTFDLRTGDFTVHHSRLEPWRVTLVNTGLRTLSGGRLRRVRSYINNDVCCMTYGDSVADVDISRLIAYHRRHGGLATLTAIQAPVGSGMAAGRFQRVLLRPDQMTVERFGEQHALHDDRHWFNGGFFVFDPHVLDYIDGDATSWETESLVRLARDGLLTAYQHEGFWFTMNTVRDREWLTELWMTGEAPWIGGVQS